MIADDQLSLGSTEIALTLCTYLSTTRSPAHLHIGPIGGSLPLSCRTPRFAQGEGTLAVIRLLAVTVLFLGSVTVEEPYYKWCMEAEQKTDTACSATSLELGHVSQDALSTAPNSEALQLETL